MLPSSPSDINYVIYHAKCADGFGAAWAAYRHLRDLHEVTYVPMHYREELPPGIDGKHIAIVDFSLEKDAFEEVVRRAASVIILDHHDTAYRRFKDDPHLVYDPNKSGAVITWEYFRGPQSTYIPWLLEYIQDTDLHRQAIPGARHVIKALYELVPWTFEAWDEAAEAAPKALEDQGHTISLVMHNLVTAAVESAEIVSFEGYEIAVANFNGRFYSSVGNALAEISPSGIGIVWWYDHAHRAWRFSVRSKGANILPICEKFGGGGHPNAGGFQVDDISLISFMQPSPRKPQ